MHKCRRFKENCQIHCKPIRLAAMFFGKSDILRRDINFFPRVLEVPLIKDIHVANMAW